MVANLAVRNALIMDPLQAAVAFFVTPGEMQCVLALLQTGNGDTTGIGRFGWSKKASWRRETRCPIQLGRHILLFCHRPHAVGQQRFRIIAA